MRKYAVGILIFFVSFLASCNGGETGDLNSSQTGQDNNDVYDIESNGIPRFFSNDYIEIDKIYSISKFRSGAGHDYSDQTELCRNMKHYFAYKEQHRQNNHVKVFSPVDGIVVGIMNEGWGESGELINKQVAIQSIEYPAFIAVLFHLDLSSNALQKGSRVSAGQHIGHARADDAIGGVAYDNDIAVRVDTLGGSRYVSYFAVITDSLFSNYVAHGIQSRDELIITKENRDANPLTCDGSRFISNDPLGIWVYLK